MRGIHICDLQTPNHRQGRYVARLYVNSCTPNTTGSAVPSGGHWGACLERKILWDDVLRYKDLTFLIILCTFKTIIQTQSILNQCLNFASLTDDFEPAKARKRLFSDFQLHFEK